MRWTQGAVGFLTSEDESSRWQAEHSIVMLITKNGVSRAEGSLKQDERH